MASSGTYLHNGAIFEEKGGMRDRFMTLLVPGQKAIRWCRLSCMRDPMILMIDGRGKWTYTTDEMIRLIHGGGFKPLNREISCENFKDEHHDALAKAVTTKDGRN